MCMYRPESGVTRWSVKGLFGPSEMGYPGNVDEIRGRPYTCKNVILTEFTGNETRRKGSRDSPLQCIGGNTIMSLIHKSTI